MKKFIYAAFAVVLAACTADLEEVKVAEPTSVSDKILNSSTDCVKGTILVRFGESAESRLAKCATRSGATRTGVEGVDAVLDGVNGYAVEPIFVVTEKNREKVYKKGLHLWYTLRFDDKSDLERVAVELAKVAEVERVQFSKEVQRVGNPQSVAAPQIQLNSASTRAESVSIPFNDPYRKYQWSLNNLGEYSEVSDGGYVSNLPTVKYGADINLLPAWKLCKGDPSIVVAVLDEGVMYTHEDLAANMWVNSGEIPGDWIDNDDNGYEDDVYGLNCNRLDGIIKWDKAPKIGELGHGTHVAGIISAVNGNGVGICGIAGGNTNKGGVKIMSVQIFYGDGGAKLENVARGMQYAADNGAHILQNSWGYKSYLADRSKPSNDASFKDKEEFGVIAEAIDYFIENGGDESGPLQGGLVIFSAGNDSVGLPGYPAAYEPCVAVAAINPALRPAYYTCYGVGTDISAPGGEALYKNGSILSTVPDKNDTSNSAYIMMQGTSQACPHVSGVAALGLSYAKQLGKRYTAKEFRSMLLSATNDIEPNLAGSIKVTVLDDSGETKVLNINYPSYKGKLGAGYIDAYKLLLQIDGTPYVTVQVGAEEEINLAPYFGDGVYNAELNEIHISEEDKAAIGLGDCIYNAGKLKVNCSKSGAATFKVTMLVGGGSLDNSSRPYPTAVTKSFVVMSKSAVSANGGWL